MNNFLNYSDFELKFLNQLDIKKHGNLFCRDGGVYNHAKSYYGKVKGLSSKFFVCRYAKNRNETITFLRSNDDIDNDWIPSVIYELYDEIVLFGESSIDEVYLGDTRVDLDDTEYLTEEEKDILKRINQINIQIKYKDKNKHTASINIVPIDDTGYTYTYFYKDSIKVGMIKCGLSNIDRIIENRDSYTDTSSETYSELFASTIDKLYGDDTDLHRTLHWLMPLFVDIYDAILYLPSIYEEKMRSELETERNKAELECFKTVKRAEKEKNEILERVQKEEARLDMLVKKYPLVSKRRQK